MYSKYVESPGLANVATVYIYGLISFSRLYDNITQDDTMISNSVKVMLYITLRMSQYMTNSQGILVLLMLPQIAMT
jgi:hypothetical protein